MADSKALVISDSQCPDFIQELFPSAERTALLHHLSFLCLGSFPKLERRIRDQAIETQMLFRSSEAVLLKCVGTSSNLVTSLFPILIEAVKKNKPKLALEYLEKARTWISDIIRAVDDMVKRYDQQTKSVGKCTSKVFKEQEATKEKLTKHSDEIKGLEDALAKLELELNKNVSDVEDIEKRIEKSTQELQDLIRNNGNYHCTILWGLFSFNRHNNNDDAIRAKQAELTSLVSEKDGLRKKGWNIKIQQTDLQLKLANCKIQQGEIPDPDHLKEVHQSLDQIRQILVDLKTFWEKVGVTLETVRDNAFVGENVIKKKGMKEKFLNSIEDAKLDWQRFGAGCYRAQNIFSIQSRTAYKFLEVNPSSLSEAERNKQYESIMEKLKKINPEGSSRATITE